MGFGACLIPKRTDSKPKPLGFSKLPQRVAGLPILKPARTPSWHSEIFFSDFLGSVADSGDYSTVIYQNGRIDHGCNGVVFSKLQRCVVDIVLVFYDNQIYSSSLVARGRVCKF